MAQTSETSGAVRIDVWLWAVRVFKSRSQATAACRAGHVHTTSQGRQRAKPATTVRVGHRVEVSGIPRPRVLVVQQLLDKRVGAPLAAAAYLDESPAPPPREERPAPVFERERGTGRPTKRERRRLDSLRGR